MKYYSLTDLIRLFCGLFHSFPVIEYTVHSVNGKIKWSLFPQAATRPVSAVWVVDQHAAGNVPLGTQ